MVKTLLKLVLLTVVVLVYLSGLFTWYRVFVVGRYYAAGTLLANGLMVLLPLLGTWLVFRLIRGLLPFGDG
jgi:type III secretory pathway component EscU